MSQTELVELTVQVQPGLRDELERLTKGPGLPSVSQIAREAFADYLSRRDMEAAAALQAHYDEAYERARKQRELSRLRGAIQSHG